jgi:hypothetical protein
VDRGAFEGGGLEGGGAPAPARVQPAGGASYTRPPLEAPLVGWASTSIFFGAAASEGCAGCSCGGGCGLELSFDMARAPYRLRALPVTAR